MTNRSRGVSAAVLALAVALDVRTGHVLPWNPALLGFSGSVRRGLVPGSLFAYDGGVDVPFLAVLR